MSAIGLDEASQSQTSAPLERHDTSADPLSAAPSAAMDATLAHAIAALDYPSVEARYRDANEFIFLDPFLPADTVATLVAEFDRLRPSVNRSWMPWVRKGGNVGYRALLRSSPQMVALYKSPALIDFCSRLAGRPLQLKSEQDDHACALYVYTRAGDYMSYHLDTCGCEENSSYTAIFGLIDRSTQRFTHKPKDDRRGAAEVRIATGPGSVAIFCGSKCYHAVSRLSAGQERVVLSVSYAENPEMSRTVRLKENVKDALLYFGAGSATQRNYSK